jgi:hypothetical protein
LLQITLRDRKRRRFAMKTAKTKKKPAAKTARAKTTAAKRKTPGAKK